MSAISALFPNPAVFFAKIATEGDLGGMENTEKPKCSLSTLNGRVKVHYDGCLMFSFNQLDFKGLYFYKDDINLYGLDIYLMNDLGGNHLMTIHFKTKETWLEVNRVLDGM